MAENTAAEARIIRSLRHVLTWWLSPEWERQALYWQAALLLLVLVTVCAGGPAIAFAVAGLTALAIVWFSAPPKVIAAIFLLFVGFTHQFRSLLVIAAAGVEWHPRELLLIALGAYCVFRLLFYPSRLPSDSMNVFVALTGAYFVWTAAVGIFAQQDIHRIASELRIPVFLLSYAALLQLVRREHLPFLRRAFCLFTMLLALIAIAFFAYSLLSGNVGSTQNALGEFVQRLVAGTLVQSVRPSGHMYYEVCLVVFVSLLFSTGISKSAKLVYAACIAVLLAALAITMMRTAYASVAVSIVLLGFLSIPSARARYVITAVCAVSLLAGITLWLSPLHTLAPQLVPNLGVSIEARFVEVAGAFRAFWQHPLVGTGMGSTFQALGLAAKTSQLAYGQDTFQTIHNVWVFFLFKGGLAGFAMILTGLIGIFVVMARRIPLLHDARERAILRGLTAAYGAQLVAMLAMPRLLYASGCVFVAMMAAYTVIATSGQRAAEPVAR